MRRPSRASRTAPRRCSRRPRAAPSSPSRAARRGASQQGPAAKAARAQNTTYYEFPLDKTDQVFTILADFGGTGPANNEIAEPNRNTDNSTYWVPNFNKAHYEELFIGEGESFKNFYLDQSNGRFLADQ